MKNAAARLITLIMLLQRKPNQKACTLAAELGVSVRTLHRYLGILDEMGIPLYSERGPNGGFSLVRGYKMPPLVFSSEEAVAVYLGASMVEEIWGELYRQPARGVLAKLDNLLPDEQRFEIAWAQRTLFATQMHRSDTKALSPVLEKIRRACREQHCLEIRYQSRSQPDPTQRQLDPYALLHRWGWWYLVGYCHLRQAVRSFRVDRIQDIQPLSQTFAIQPGFNIHDYVASESYTQPTLQASLRFPPAAAWIANEVRSLWEQTQPQPDGSVIVSLAISDLESAANMLIPFLPEAEILEPPELRQLVCQRAAAIVLQYSPTN